MTPRDSDWPLTGPYISKSDRQQGQANRSEHDGEFLLPRIIEEFGDDAFSESDYKDAFYSYVPTGSGSETSRKLNVIAALNSLVENEHIEKNDNLYQVTDLGRAFSDQLENQH
jgi:hypothetical protein